MKPNTRNDSTNGVNNVFAVSHGPPAARCSYSIMLILLAVSMFWFSACSGTTPEVSNVENCESGGVKVNGGACENPKTCGERSCLPGYKCNDANTCEIEFPCQTNDECSGLAACEAGRCVNPRKCEEDINCLEGYQCYEQACVPSKCSKHCTRGECAREGKDAGQCVSKAVCTEDNEKKTCVEGELCVNGECKTETEICDQLACESINSGVCAPKRDRNKCVSIIGKCEIGQCAEGEYCDMETSPSGCRENKCSGDGICPNGGECKNPKTGDCVHKEECDEHSDCAGGRGQGEGALLEKSRKAVCVQLTNSGGSTVGKCVNNTDEEIIGTVCKGNQVGTVTKDASNGRRYTVKCEDAEWCIGKDDCVDESKVCDRETGECVAADHPTVSCNPDDAENNNDLSRAKEVKGYAGEDNELTLCGPTASGPADVDYFKFNPSELGSNNTNKIVVSVVIKPEDVGNKKILVELLGPDGTTIVGPEQSWDDNGSKSSIVLKHDNFENGAYYVKISIADDQNATAKAARLRYQLLVSVVNNDDSKACENLEGEKPVTGGMLTGTVYNSAFKELMPKCRNLSHTPSVSPYDNVHKLLVEKRRSYHFAASSNNTALDLNVSIRRVCESDDSELPDSCHDEKGAGVAEDFYRVLDPGIYYVVVSSKDENVPENNGEYSLAITYNEIKCEPRENTCGEVDGIYTEKVCNERQTDIDTNPCEHGCIDGKACKVEQGDTCNQPLATVALGKDYVGSKVLLQGKSNNYDSAMSCGGSDDSSTKGKDVVVQATVEPGQVLIARASSIAGATIYFTRDCDRLGKGCFGLQSVSKRGDTATATFINDAAGAVTETINVIIDHPEAAAGKEPPYFTAEVLVREKACEKDAFGCFKEGSQSRLCNETASGYVRTERCYLGCKENTSGGALSSASAQKARIGQCFHSANDGCFDYEKDAIVDAVVDTKVEIEDPKGGKQPKSHFQSVEYLHLLDDDVNVPDGICGDISTSERGGKDAIYKVVLRKNEYAQVTVKSDLDMKVWAVQSKTVTKQTDNTDLVEEHAVCGLSDDKTPMDRDSNRYTIKNTICLDGSDHHKTDAHDHPDPEILYILNKTSRQDGEYEEYYVVVEPSSKLVDDGSFEVEIFVRANGEGNAKANTNGACDANSNELTYYDSVGIKQNVQCGSQCVLGQYCDNGTTGVGNSCHLPKILYSHRDKHNFPDLSGTELGDLTTAAFSNELGVFKHKVDACFFDRYKTPTGDEAIYMFDLTKDDVLSIDVTTASEDIATFFQKDCGNIPSKETSCFGAINGLGLRKLGYKATKDEQIFFVVKQASASAGEFVFKWEVTKSGCAPGTTHCLENKSTLIICDEKGNESSIDCSCEHDRCILGETTKDGKKLYEADTCADALQITSGGVYLIEKDMSTAKSSPSCAAASGNDVFFKIQPPSTSIVQVKVHAVGSKGVPSAYMFDTCEELAKDNCIGVDSRPNSYSSVKFKEPAVIHKYVPQGSSVYLGIDEDMRGWRPSNSDTYIEIEFLKAQCQPNDKTTCDNSNLSGNGVLTSCVDYLFSKYECTGQCTGSGADAKCVEGTGTTCYDALDLIETAKTAGTGNEHEGTLTGQLVTSKKSYDLISPESIRKGFSGHCALKEMLEGGEKYYSIHLNAGDMLTVDYSRTEYFASHRPYIIRGCWDQQECLAITQEPSQNQTLKFKARETDMYYLVVDTTNGSDDLFNLHYKIERPATPECIPGTSYCQNDNKVIACKPDGTWSEGFDCPDPYTTSSGKSCDKGRCVIDAERSDKLVCTDLGNNMHKVGKGFIGTIPLYQPTYESDVKMRDSACVLASFSSWTEQKRDAFFYLEDLQLNAIVDVYLVRPDQYERPIVYFFTDCTQPIDSCEISGVADSSSFAPLKVTYKNTTGKDKVYFGVTTSKGWGNQTSPTIYVDVNNPDCNPATFINKCDNAGNLIYCDETGFEQPYACETPASGGDACIDVASDDAIPGVCAAPRANTCIDPERLDLTQSPIEKDGSLSTMTNASTLTDNNTCTAVPQHGPDRFYSLELQDGQTLTAKVESTVDPTVGPTEDLSIYLTETCTEIEDHCLAGSDRYGAGTTPEELTYTNNTGAPQTLRLVVDSAYSTAKGTFKLTVNVQ